jgi:hypothetical protein
MSSFTTNAYGEDLIDAFRGTFSRLTVVDPSVSDEAQIEDLVADTLTVPSGGQTINEISIDGTMAGNSDSAVPTEKAVVSYLGGTSLFPHAVNKIYVGKHGNDANDGLNWWEAKLTIVAALSAASAGDVVVGFDSGVYVENINIVTNKRVYLPNASLTGNVTLSNGADLTIMRVNSSTGTSFSLNAASSIAHVHAKEVLCTANANTAVCNNGRLILHLDHAEIENGDLVSETNSDCIFVDLGTVLVKGTGDVFATSGGASICGTAKCISEDGGTGTLFKGSPAGAAYINICACSVNLTNLSNINALAVCRLTAANLGGALNELGAGNVYIGPPYLYGTSSITLGLGTDIQEFSIDGTMAGNSDNACPTEKAVKTYADAHANSDGSSHTYIDQDITTAGTPTFNRVWLNTAKATSAVLTGSSTAPVDQVIQMYYDDQATLFWAMGVSSAGHLKFGGQSTAREVWWGTDQFGHSHHFYTTVAGKETVFTNTTGTWDITPVNNTTDAMHLVDGYLHLPLGAQINEISTDDTMAGDSDLAVPTEQAVKGYVDTHSSSDGSSHTFISQDVTTTGTPAFVSVNLGDTTLSKYKQATHSATWTGPWDGGAGDQSGTIYYTIVGDIAHLRISAIYAANNASSSAALTVGTYLPAELRPTAAVIYIPCVVRDNSVTVPGSFEVASTGAAAFYVATDSTSLTNFQNAGNTGWYDTAVSYLLS